MKKLEEIFNKPITETLYHYTDGSAFLGIVKNNEMWASHIRFMNDTKEGLLALDRLEEVVNDNKNLVKGHNIDSLIKSVKKSFAKETASLGIFIISFCEVKDDLNLWRGYANKTLPYCIGFNTKEFLKVEEIKNYISEVQDFLINPWDPKETKKKVFLLPCIYDYAEQVELIKEILSDSVESIRVLEPTSEAELGEEIAKRLVCYAPLIKHEVFKDEKEWRAIILYEKSFAPNFTKQDIEDALEEAKDSGERERLEYLEESFEDNEVSLRDDREFLNYRMGRSYIIPFFRYKINKKVFKEIIIGTCPDKDSVYKSTVYFLSKNDFTYEESKSLIEYTKIPYRNW